MKWETPESLTAYLRNNPSSIAMRAAADLIESMQESNRPRAFLLSGCRKNRVYLAGPMTGLPDYNYPAFNAAAAALRSQGLHVENPADHGVVDGAEWADYLRHDLGRLATCEAVYLLPGWHHSKGATLEVHIATALGMEIRPFEEVACR